MPCLSNYSLQFSFSIHVLTNTLWVIITLIILKKIKVMHKIISPNRSSRWSQQRCNAYEILIFSLDVFFFVLKLIINSKV